MAGRAKRSSALRARTAVQQLAKEPTEEIPKKEKRKEEEEEFQAPLTASSEEPSDVGNGESDDEGVTDLDESESEEAPRKLGRPKKGTKPPGKKVYKKLSDFTIYGVGPLPLSTWKRAVDNARPMKRSKVNKKALPRYRRPPTELVSLKPNRPTSHSIPASLQTNKELPIRSIPEDPLEIKVSDGEEVHQLTMGTVMKLGDMQVGAAGNGPVTGLAWCRCCGKHLAISTYPSAEYKDYLNTPVTTPSSISIWKWSKSGLARILVIEHTFGPIRRLDWYHGSSFLAAAFADQTVRIFHVPLESTGCIKLSNMKFAPFPNCSTFAWCPNRNQIVTGSFDGYVTLWSLEEPSPTRLCHIKACSKPIWSISWNPVSPSKLVVGSYDNAVRIIDLSNPFEVVRCSSIQST